MNAGVTATGGVASRTASPARESGASGGNEDAGSFAGIMDSRARAPERSDDGSCAAHAEAGAAAPRGTGPGGSRSDATSATTADLAQSEGCEDDAGTLDDEMVETLLGVGEGTATAVTTAALAVDPNAMQARSELPPAVPAAPWPPPPLRGEAFERSLGEALERLDPAASAAGGPAAQAGERLAATLEAAIERLADGTGIGTTADGGDAPTLLPAGEVRSTARTPGSEAAAAARAPELRSPPGTPGWTDELGSRVSWMLERGEQVASLRLTPENLGPLEVRIAVREGETTVWFGASQAETRAALEQSLPRLREMLGASGLSLANAGVFSHTPRDPQRGFTAAALARASQESGADPGGASVTYVTRHGLIDLYA
ncbi:MAG: flagellar hook-length control protein FliK [Gammaproteobacteria bacterium]|nr:flagellar hook-length control protein FliK [Gammaproteobacteria bacterium]